MENCYIMAALDLNLLRDIKNHIIAYANSLYSISDLASNTIVTSTIIIINITIIFITAM